MPSDTSSSTSDHDLDPNHQSIGQQLASVTLTLSDGEPSAHQDANGVVGGSVNQNTQIALEEQVQCSSVAADETEEVRESSDHGVVWGRTVSELEMDGPSSPSSSGYAGERGSSSATSESIIDDLVEQDEIEEVRNDAAVDGISDSQMSWLPGKRHDDEVCIVNIFVICFLIVDLRI